jgi:hypothetical protein
VVLFSDLHDDIIVVGPVVVTVSGSTSLEYVARYNKERSHRGLSLQTPEPRPTLNRADGDIVRVAKLGGRIDEYYRIAA